MRAKRRVAQFGRALRSGRRGRRFKSCHADDAKLVPVGFSVFKGFRFRKPLIFPLILPFFYPFPFIPASNEENDHACMNHLTNTARVKYGVFDCRINSWNALYKPYLIVMLLIGIILKRNDTLFGIYEACSGCVESKTVEYKSKKRNPRRICCANDGSCRRDAIRAHVARSYLETAYVRFGESGTDARCTG